MADLSPAALSVWCRFCEVVEEHGPPRLGIAAALRAAADQVVPEEQRPPRCGMRPGGTGALTPEEGAEDQRAATRRRLRAIAAELEGNHPESSDSSDEPAVSDDREPASVMDQLKYQLFLKVKADLIREVINQALKDTTSVHWRVADTGEQLVRATDLLAWAEHMENQMQQLDD